MARILGIDPGSRITGYGVIDCEGSTLRHVAHGTIRTADGPFPLRLRSIFEQLSQVLDEHRPDAVAVEQGFVLATSFHPEMTGDTRFHEYFVDRVRRVA